MEKTRQSSRKRHKIVPSIDRLSGLPDAILCHILSFLPTKLSVATSILARRWRFLWAHVPNLYFNCEYPHDGDRLLDTVNKVMLLYKVQSMNTFRLWVRDFCSDSQLEKCLTASIVRNVKNLDLCLENQVMLPRRVFTCKTLVDLRLNFCVIIPMTGAVCLPALKKLHLDSVQYESDESLPYLLSACPVLEDLMVDRFVMDGPDMVCCYISSPTVKRVMLDSKFDISCEPYSARGAFRLKIDTPALRYLQLHDSISEHFSAGVLSSLIEADIILNCIEPIEGNILYSRSVIDFVGRLCNVKCLKLSSRCVKVPDSAFSALTIKFHNLTKLELAADWRFLSYFLGNADNLEVLIIRDVNIDLKYWMEPYQVPTCLSSHLRTVTIDQFGCTEHEFELIRYLLRNAKVLKRMEIYSQRPGINLKGKFKALKRISKFQRGSEACELVFN